MPTPRLLASPARLACRCRPSHAIDRMTDLDHGKVFSWIRFSTARGSEFCERVADRLILEPHDVERGHGVQPGSGNGCTKERITKMHLMQYRSGKNDSREFVISLGCWCRQRQSSSADQNRSHRDEPTIHHRSCFGTCPPRAADRVLPFNQLDEMGQPSDGYRRMPPGARRSASTLPPPGRPGCLRTRSARRRGPRPARGR